MNRNRCRSLVFMAVFLFIALIVPAYAEDYISKDVPPDEVLLRTIRSRKHPDHAIQIKFIGKFKESDNKYIVFVKGNDPLTLLLLRLDNNIWMLGDSVVQK